MKEINLTKGFKAIVDDEDYEWLSQFKWCAKFSNNYWYAVRGVGPRKGMKIVRMHRVIAEKMVGHPLDRKDEVDHIHGNTLDNRRSELRICTHVQNMHNAKVANNNRTGYHGVGYYRQTQKWRARICINGKSVHIGFFDSAEQAAKARDQVAKQERGEFARLNFPDQ